MQRKKDRNRPSRSDTIEQSEPSEQASNLHRCCNAHNGTSVRRKRAIKVPIAIYRRRSNRCRNQRSNTRVETRDTTFQSTGSITYLEGTVHLKNNCTAGITSYTASNTSISIYGRRVKRSKNRN